MIRKAIVSGQFYPQTEAGLKKMLAGLIDMGAEKQDAIGVILPHAGYMYSGSVAGAAISRIEIKKTAVILGTNHTGGGKPFSIMKEGGWATPLGEIKIDTEIADSILKESSLIEEDLTGHLHEHSIEVQLPFLQYLKNDVRIVPITISEASLREYQQLGKEIAAGFKKTGRPGFLIASTDMTHYEPKETAEQKDAMAIDAMLALDEEKLFNTVKSRSISMCGAAPVCVFISACKKLGAKKASLVKYQTSGDVSEDYSSVVGYAGLIIT